MSLWQMLQILYSAVGVRKRRQGCRTKLHPAGSRAALLTASSVSTVPVGQDCEGFSQSRENTFIKQSVWPAQEGTRCGPGAKK